MTQGPRRSGEHFSAEEAPELHNAEQDDEHDQAPEVRDSDEADDEDDF